MPNLAPVVLFVYNRPWHTAQTIEALKKNILADQTELFIYSDGAKNEEAISQVLEVRKYLETVSDFKEVSVVKRDTNFGLACNIIDGVTSIVNRYGSVIVLEDDLVTSTNFLSFMNDALSKYKNEQHVYAISGYSFADGGQISESTYFLSITSSWSWATWDKKWAIFSRDEDELRNVINDDTKTRDFNFNNSYDYVSMAKLQLDHKINSWAIYWYLSIFKEKGLTFFPAERLVRNIGHDGTGTHCKNGYHESELNDSVYDLTNDIYEKDFIKNIVQEALIKKGRLSFFQKIILKTISLFNRIKHR